MQTLIDELDLSTRAEDLRNAVSKALGARTKTKGEALDLVASSVKRARTEAEVHALLTSLFSALPAAAVKEWATDLDLPAGNKELAVSALALGYTDDVMEARGAAKKPRPAKAPKSTARAIASAAPGEVTPEILYVSSAPAPPSSKLDDWRNAAGSYMGSIGLSRRAPRTEPVRVTPDEARRRFDLGGLPRDHHVYVRDPLDHSGRRYLIAASAATDVLHRKIASFLEVATYLGARRIELRNVEVRARGGGATVGLDVLAQQVGFRGRVASESDHRISVVLDLAPSRRRPEVPAGLVPFVDREPMLKSMAVAAERGVATRFEVVIETREALAIEAHLEGLQWANAGVSLGGDLKRVDTTQWEFVVHFVDPPPVAERQGRLEHTPAPAAPNAMPQAPQQPGFPSAGPHSGYQEPSYPAHGYHQAPPPQAYPQYPQQGYVPPTHSQGPAQYGQQGYYPPHPYPAQGFPQQGYGPQGAGPFAPAPQPQAAQVPYQHPYPPAYYQPPEPQQPMPTAPAYVICANCRTPSPGDARFCGVCGSSSLLR